MWQKLNGPGEQKRSAMVNVQGVHEGCFGLGLRTEG
jgi:hypothetical protein